LSDQIRQIEELSLNALPALQTLTVNGWVVRFANGHTGRANSVNPLYSAEMSAEELAATVAYCESLYERQNLPAMFKLTPASQPPALDDFLVKCGYRFRENATTVVETADLSAFAGTTSAHFQDWHIFNEAWYGAFCRLNNVPEARQPVMRQMLQNIVPDAFFAALIENGEILAVGLAVAERGYVGLFDIVADERARGRGLGTELVTHLLNWGINIGAHTAYLQVVEGNAPARRLYRKLGFQEAYKYWYRVK
jgi:N-acetylglutamate synthase